MAHTTAHTTDLRIMDRITDRTTGPRTTVIAIRATVGAVAGAARAVPALAATQTRDVAHMGYFWLSRCRAHTVMARS